MNDWRAFLTTTSAHGLARTQHANSKTQSRLWTLICFICYVTTIIFIVKIIAEASNPKNVVTQVDLDVMSVESELLLSV